MNHMLLLYTIHDNAVKGVTEATFLRHLNPSDDGLCLCKDVSIYYSSTNNHKTKTGIICFFLMVLRTCSSICLKDGVDFIMISFVKDPKGTLLSF